MTVALCCMVILFIDVNLMLTPHNVVVRYSCKVHVYRRGLWALV